MDHGIRSLVAQQSSNFKLPIANLHENLRTTYERMLERGPERFQVKPSGLPDRASLHDQLPNFTAALDEVKRHVARRRIAAMGWR